MASKSSSPGPNPTTPTPAAKQARSRKAATQNTDVGRAGSAGGIVLEKEKSKATPVPKPKQPQAQETSDKTPRRKPRKLNKEPTTSGPASTSKETAPAEPPSAAEIEALKSRVRGLEAKVEELYKSGNLDRPGRSPRRRGKGRKGSSQQQVPTLSNSKTKPDNDNDNDNDDDAIEDIGRGDAHDEEENVEELVRLEGELESARQDLAAFRPRSKRMPSSRADEDVEELPREDTAGNSRHVTLSGSYRIPLPASVSVDDVKTIQSGVSAAQNVARSFLEQRRAVRSSSSTSSPSSSSTSKPSSSSNAASSSSKKAQSRPTPRSVSSSMEIVPVQDAGGKQSWSEWIGGYSVAISRAVKNIEHEAVVESQRSAGAGGGGGAKGKGKRPGVKSKISGEQVQGLMG